MNLDAFHILSQEDKTRNIIPMNKCVFIPYHFQLLTPVFNMHKKVFYRMQIFAIHQNQVTLMYIYNGIEMANKVIFLFNTIFVDGYCQFLSKITLRVYFMKCGRRYSSFISLFVELTCHYYIYIYVYVYIFYLYIRYCMI